MAHLSIGDRVSDLGGAHEGTLIEIDGETAYVMQANGVEIEFAFRKLKPYEAPKVKLAATLLGPRRDRALTPVQRTLLASVPAEILNAVALSYDAGTNSGTRPVFAALPDEKKLETIRVYLPSLPRQLLTLHVKLVIAFRSLSKTS